MKRLILAGLLLVTAARAGEPGGSAPSGTPPSAPATLATVIKHVDPAAAERLLGEKKVTVLDIRTPGEFKAGHIAGATNLDYRDQQFEQRLSAVDRSKPYLVHCASGRRSTSALAVFKKLGFKEIVHLDGGLNAWQKAAKPIAK